MRHIPSMATLVSMRTANVRDALPSPEQRQPMRDSWPGIAAPDTLEVELPMMPESTTEVAVEPVS